MSGLVHNVIWNIVFGGRFCWNSTWNCEAFVSFAPTSGWHSNTAPIEPSSQ